MNVLGLFSGIGGFELGFERAGFNIAAMCECEPYARAVLGKHWPRVPVFPDVRQLTGHALDVLGFPRIDVITGGFPCQDISLAGKGAGLAGERSGLWREYHRLIDEIRPSWVVIENVSALRSRGLDTVLGSLAALGYDAEWHCIPASAVGAPHRRDRVWIVGHPARQPRERDAGSILGTQAQERGARIKNGYLPIRPEHAGAGGSSGLVADADQVRRNAGLEGCAVVSGDAAVLQLPTAQRGGAVRHADSQGEHVVTVDAEMGGAPIDDSRGWWLVEPDVGRVANGVPRRVDRLRALGNAVVPQIPEMIARAILAAEHA